MAHKPLHVVVSKDMIATVSDVLSSDCLQVECTNKIVTPPGTPTRVNIAIKNTSTVGRMARLQASYDSRMFTVIIPTQDVYIGPEGKTLIYAVVTPLQAGQSSIGFDAV